MGNAVVVRVSYKASGEGPRRTVNACHMHGEGEGRWGAAPRRRLTRSGLSLFLVGFGGAFFEWWWCWGEPLVFHEVFDGNGGGGPDSGVLQGGVASSSASLFWGWNGPPPPLASSALPSMPLAKTTAASASFSSKEDGLLSPLWASPGVVWDMPCRKEARSAWE